MPLRHALLLLAILLPVASPVAARVLSYAPYTSRNADPSIHDRSNRYFALVERGNLSPWWWQGWSLGELVIYDSRGEEEPRVVRPSAAESDVYLAAIHQTTPSAPEEARVMLLAASFETAHGAGRIHFSSDGGATWVQVTAMDGQWIAQQSDVDYGGRFSGGMGSQIQIGNDEVPFVVATDAGVYAVSADGTAKKLLGGHSRMVGRNAAGTQFLVNRNQRIEIVNLEGQSMELMTADSYASYSGWITANDTSYIQVLRPEGRFLVLRGIAPLQFIAGPYGATSVPTVYPPVWSPDTMRFFAVPTHDYEGAWLIQREAGKPTTLLRHTPAAGLQTQWADPAGPEVEALIPGASGSTVLVQVHRERTANVATPFIDPAIAVWRTGEGAPGAYDELYLNEEWNKGFVRVDVDAMEAGEPFVFNSGYLAPSEIIISPPIGGGSDVVQEWGVVRASLRQHLVLPGVSRTAGAYESSWASDVTVLNPFELPQEVEFRFVPTGVSGEAPSVRSTTLQLPARRTQVFRDVLSNLFGIEDGSGTLHILPTAGVTATVRTFSRKGEGTYGFGMPAIDAFNAAGPRFPLTFAGAFPGAGFRTNILLTDTSGRGTAAALYALGTAGPVGANEVEWPAPALGTSQLNEVGAAVGMQPGGGGLKLEVSRGTAIATVVAMDNRTNDPTWFPPDLGASVGRGIPVIAHTDGANGARFRSDLYLLNPADETRAIQLEAKSWNGPERKTVNFTLLPLEARVIPDALATLFGMQGTARVTYGAPEEVDGVRVTSRTYTEDDGGATYGSLVPPMNGFQLATQGDVLEIHGIVGGGSFRTNLGLVEFSGAASQQSAEVRISILDDRLQSIASFDVTLPAQSGMQLDNLFVTRGIPMPAAATITVEVLSGGIVGAYVSLVDNVTNDSNYLAAQLGAKE